MNLKKLVRISDQKFVEADYDDPKVLEKSIIGDGGANFLGIAYDEATAGPETSTGVVKLRGHFVAMQMHLGDWNSFYISIDPKMKGWEVVDINAGESLWAMSTEDEGYENADVVPTWEQALYLVDKWFIENT